MAGSAKGQEYFALLSTDNISSATLQTELGTAQNLVDFINMFRFSTVRSTLLKDANAIRIIQGSALASNNSIFTRFYCIETGSSNSNFLPLFRYHPKTGTFSNFTDFNEITLSGASRAGSAAFSGIGFDKMYFYFADGSQSDNTFVSTNIITGVQASEFASATNDTYGLQDHGHGFWTPFEAFQLGGREGTAEHDDMVGFRYVSKTLFNVTAVLSGNRFSMAGCQSLTRALIVGGDTEQDNNTSFSTTIESVSKQSFTVTAAFGTLGTAKGDMAGSENNTYGYVLGGNASGNVEQTAVDRIAFATGTVNSAQASLSTADSSNCACRDYDQIYYFKDTSDVLKYNTTTDTVAPASQSITPPSEFESGSGAAEGM